MGKDRMDSGRGRRANVVKQQRQSSMRNFYILLGAVAVLGSALLVYNGSRAKVQVTTVDLPPGSISDAEGYRYGSATAPVEVIEFADFECPGCAQWSTVVEPDVRKRIFDTGKASLRFFDFPLEMHRNTLAAANAAACAADQNKFWEMHDRIFFGRADWATESTSRPDKFMAAYARELSLDMGRWQKCFDDRAHQARILGNKAQGIKLKVGQTPTFIIAGRMHAGGPSYDEFAALIDSATKAAPKR